MRRALFPAEESIAGLDVETSHEPRDKRHDQGIFYTPAPVTRFIVDRTLGRVFEERRRAAFAAPFAGEPEAWEAYRDALSSIRVLDPSCGAGAFLVAAYLALAREHERIGAALTGLRGAAPSIDLARTILERNLFGVDLDGEAVLRARRSLQLAAGCSAKLAALDVNIAQGDTLDDEARWQQGFDVVIGNPPYIRHELLGHLKDRLSRRYAAHHGMADAFVYFFERGLSLLVPGGRLGYVVTNKWLRAGYAEPLRRLLAQQTTLETLIDLGHAPVFPGADAFPCIVTLQKAIAKPGHTFEATSLPRERLDAASLHRVPQSRLSGEPWRLDPPRVDALYEKLGRAGKPLSAYAGTKPYYGLKTGCNEAFFVDGETRAHLLAEDPGSAEMLKPLLRGQDIGRWAPSRKDLWLIHVPWDHPIGEHPAVLRHLESHREALEARAEVRAGRFPWYALSRYGAEYHPLFASPKIVYQVIQFRPAYALDRDGLFLNDKAFFIPTGDPWLLAVLNAPLLWWHNWRYLGHMKDEALTPLGVRMERLPIAKPSAQARAEADRIVPRLVALAAQEGGGGEASELERRLSDLVNEAYGLTPGEIDLMWSTAPPRMPIAQPARAGLYRIPQAQLDGRPWNLERADTGALFEKIRNAGSPLKDCVGDKPYRGIVTGFNEAFLVDTATRNRLVKEDARSAEILRKYFRGEDIGRWTSEWDGMWMIFARRGVDIDAFPAVKKHLLPFKASLEPRPAGWAGEEWPGRKPGSYKWFELQDPAEYWEMFASKKIVYQEIQFHSAYALDTEGVFLNNKCFLIPSSDLWLLAVLNSPLMWWYTWRYLPHMKDEALSPSGVKMEQLPIVPPTDEARHEAEHVVPKLVHITKQNNDACARVLDLLRMQFDVATPGRKLEDFAGLSSDDFVAEVLKRRPRSAGKLKASALKSLRETYEEEALPIQARRREAMQLERRLSDLVNQAYGLTPAEIDVMRSTAPPRTPAGK